MTHAEASVAATSAGHAVELPTLDSLFLFLESLRESGFRIDGQQIAAAERLLLDAHAGGPASDAGRRLKYRLAPAIAKSETEQEDFYRRFDTWNGPVLLERPVQSELSPKEKPRGRRTAWRLRGMIAPLALLLIAGALAIARLAGPGQPEPPAVERPAGPLSPPPGQAIDLPRETFQASEKLVSPYYPAARIAIALLPIIAFAGWMQRRWRKRVMFMTRGSIVGDLALITVPMPVDLSKALFTSGDFRKSAQDLRKHRYLPTRKLDVDRTVDATVRRAGLFDPVYRDRAQLPEYVFLIEQNGANDHLARLFDLAIARLRDEHVFIEHYYFQTDPRHLQDVARASSLMTLGELAARTDDHRLFVIGTADGFFHPLTGEVENWVAGFEPWTARTLLSTRPLQQWTVAELRLLEEGFSLATSETSGFAKAGEKLALGDDAAELLEGVIVERPVRRKPVAPPSLDARIPDFAVFHDVDQPWCPEMVALPAGEFLMGSPKEEKERYDNEGPQHRVTIGRRFAIGRYPVMFDEYDHFCGATKREKPEDRGWGRGKRPVINVSWRDAVAYCDWLAKATGKPYRLPSEAEWEYACRAGTTTRYAFGDEITPKQANCEDSKLDKTTEVGAYSPNPWGLCDMHGNVWEWVEDVWYDSYKRAPTDGSAWTEGEGQESSRNRVGRGGSWVNLPRILRSAGRGGNHPGSRYYNLGFRVARTLD